MLPPWVRIATGAVLVAVGVVAPFLQLSFYGVLLMVFGLGFGLPLLAASVRDLARARVERAELIRAREELPRLREVVAVAATKLEVRRLLRERGFTTEKAVRWLALECGVVLGR